MQGQWCLYSESTSRLQEQKNHIFDLCHHFDGLVQERHNSIANALELPFSCTYPSNCNHAKPRRHPIIYIEPSHYLVSPPLTFVPQSMA